MFIDRGTRGFGELQRANASGVTHAITFRSAEAGAFWPNVLEHSYPYGLGLINYLSTRLSHLHEFVTLETGH